MHVAAHARTANAVPLWLALCFGACVNGGSISDSAGTTPAGGATGTAGTGAPSTPGAPGQPNAGTSGMSTPQSDGWPAFAPSQSFGLRRLTNEQYASSVKSLLGVTVDPTTIERVSAVAGFSAIGASTASVSGSGVGQFEAAARQAAQMAFASAATRSKLLTCTPAGAKDEACAKTFVSSFGRRAFRRPLTSDEVSRYSKVTLDIASAAGDAFAGFEAITSAFLQSPNFLYLTEVGVPDPKASQRNRYTDWEMAARLSYFLTNDTPDDALLAAAESGGLSNDSDVRKQAERLLSLPSARETTRRFFAELLALDALDTLTRPVELFPKFTPGLGPAMKQSTLSTIEEFVFTQDGDYRHLFDQRSMFVNKALAALYDVPAPNTGGFSSVALPTGSPRLGLLTQPGVLAARDHNDSTSPTKRGLFVLTRLLCQDLPLSAPADLQIPPPPSGALTARQKLEQHAKTPVCNGCHRTMDSVGLSLERFDAIGAYRKTDQNMTIDESGQIGELAYQGAAGLGALLRDHPALRPCLVSALYSAATGHRPTTFDKDTFTALVSAFDQGGARVRPLLTAIATSDGFRLLPKP